MNLPVTDFTALNSRTILSEMRWLDQLFRFRAWQMLEAMKESEQLPGDKTIFADERLFADVKTMQGQLLDPAMPPEGESPYGDFLRRYGFDITERSALLLSMIPHLMPGVLEKYFSEPAFEAASKAFAFRRTDSGRYMPTGETLLFLLAGGDLEMRMRLFSLFDDGHPFRKHDILSITNALNGEAYLSGILSPSTDIIDLFTFGYTRPPQFSKDFPAKYITTEMDWDDLVLAPVTRMQVEEVKVWMKHRTRLLDELGMRKRIHPGYKILFYGPPGTGKTLTAVLLGNFIGKDVFRIDLSSVVSKYIGETEKNLANIFDKAMYSDWILFFDEADALFGARTKVSSSHDRYANQEVSYLLQRIEDFPGIVILSTNMKNNIDDAFARRFQSMVYFPFPKAEERFNLWQKAFPAQLKMNIDIDFRKIAAKFELTGGQITNIVAWCSLMALEKGDETVTEASLRDGVARELAKEGRTL